MCRWRSWANRWPKLPGTSPRRLRPPAIFLPWPMGHHFGVPFHRDMQRRVLFEALKLLETATESGTIRDILIRWAEVRREAKTLTDQGRNL
jgi:hypothetical protein